MGDQNSEDWLPPGWTVQVKVRKNGKKDKHYYGPSGVKLYSKVEVLRHLSKSSCSSNQSKEKQNGVPEHPSSYSGRSINNERRSSARPKKEKKVKPQASAKDISSHINNMEGGSPTCKEEEKVCVEELLKDICSYVDALEESTVESQEDKKESPKQDAEEKDIGGSFNSEACSPNQVKVKEKVIPEPPTKDVSSSLNSKECSSTQSREEEKANLEKSEMDICGDTMESSLPCHEEKKRASLPPIREKKKARLNQSAKNVEVEKVVAEGLPPGWIKEIKVTRKNNSVRRDLYYTDPVTGYIFRSMKDACRYLETGDIGRLAIKPKDKGGHDMELEDAKPDLPVSGPNEIIPVTDDKLTSVSGVNGMRKAEEDSLEKKVAATDEQMSGSAQTEGPTELETTPDQCRQTVAADMLKSNLSKSRDLEQNERSGFGGSNDVSTPGLHAAGRVSMDMDVTSSNLPESKGLEQNEEKTCSEGGNVILTPETKVQLEQPLVESVASGDKGSQHGLRRSRKKNNLTLPRRSSRRLAGVAVDPALEISKVRGLRIVAKQTDREESGKANMSHTVDCSPTLQESKRMDPPEVSPQISCPKQEDTSLDAKESNCIPEEVPATKEGAGAEKLEAERENGPDEKPPLPFDLPSGDILADPCIEFAIKTLTGVDFDAAESTIKPTESEDPCLDAHPRKALTEKGEIDREVDKKQGCSVSEAPGKLSSPEKIAGKVSSDETGNETPGSSVNLPFEDTWADPCIEFAIKTLTGAIPVEDDLDINDLMQQQIRSSQIQESNDLNFSSGSLDNFCRTDLLWQHSDAADKANYRQQSSVGPAASPTGNADLRSSGGTLLHQRRQDRTRKFQR